MSRRNRKKRRGEIAEILAREERRSNVAQLLKGRMSYRQIASALGVSLGTVSSDVKVIEQRWVEEQLSHIKKHKARDLAIIDDAVRGLTTKVRAGDPAAVDKLLKCIERRAAMLGYDAPKRLDSHHTGDGPMFKDLVDAAVEDGMFGGKTEDDPFGENDLPEYSEEDLDRVLNESQSLEPAKPEDLVREVPSLEIDDPEFHEGK